MLVSVVVKRVLCMQMFGYFVIINYEPLAENHKRYSKLNNINPKQNLKVDLDHHIPSFLTFPQSPIMIGGNFIISYLL
jgi:hypothetical protein